jgi:hypothetical protein
MKYLIALLLSASAQAKTLDVVAELNSVDHVIRSVQLTAAGTVQIVKTDGSTATMTLSKTNAETLMNDVQSLSTAELVTTHHDIVCMMAIDTATLRQLSVVDARDAMRLTLSARSCALPDYTAPKDEFQLYRAEELRSALLVLGRQLAND